jgi:hypothetical protein
VRDDADFTVIEQAPPRGWFFSGSKEEPSPRIQEKLLQLAVASFHHTPPGFGDVYPYMTDGEKGSYQVLTRIAQSHPCPEKIWFETWPFELTATQILAEVTASRTHPDELRRAIVVCAAVYDRIIRENPGR